MEILGYLLIVAYFIMLWHIFPHGRNSLDIFKLNPVLLPFWWKFIGIGWLAIVFVYSISKHDFNPSTNRFLLTGIYFGLMQIAFSKEKNEDEFSDQIRIKAMYISIISLFIIVGVFSSFGIATPNSLQDIPFQFLMMLFSSLLIVYLIYFYWTKYGFKWNKNEK